MKKLILLLLLFPLSANAACWITAEPQPGGWYNSWIFDVVITNWPGGESSFKWSSSGSPSDPLSSDIRFDHLRQRITKGTCTNRSHPAYVSVKVKRDGTQWCNAGMSLNCQPDGGGIPQ